MTFLVLLEISVTFSTSIMALSCFLKMRTRLNWMVPVGVGERNWGLDHSLDSMFSLLLFSIYMKPLGKIIHQHRSVSSIPY